MGKNISKEHINETMNQMAGQTTPAAIEETYLLDKPNDRDMELFQSIQSVKNV